MPLPSTQPLDGDFWYVLDDRDEVVWKPRPKLRGEFYLGWLGQNKNVTGAGLVRLTQGQLTHICTHGTPYYWLQPYEVLPATVATLRGQQALGADTMRLDFSLGGWTMRDQTPPQAIPLPDAPVPSATLKSLFPVAVNTIVENFRSEGEPPPPLSQPTGLLARAASIAPVDPLEILLGHLKHNLGEPNVVPTLVDLVGHDINILPAFRQSDLFEQVRIASKLSPPRVARVVLSAIYHLAQVLQCRRLNGTLLLNSLRQRHPFDVTWGADFLVRCFGMSTLIRLLQVAVVKERDDQVRGNVLDLLQELGYGSHAGLGNEVLESLIRLLQGADSGFAQVVESHRSFLQNHLQQHVDTQIQ